MLPRWTPLRTAIAALLIALLAGLLLPTAAAAPQESEAPIDPRLERFDEFVAKAVQDWMVPGLAVSVVREGRIVFARGYGVRELGLGEPVDEHTLFAIGSTTKAMTAAAIGMLVDEGKVSWNDPVRKHLPWFELYDPFVTREVTVRDLLTHRAGLGNADFLWYGTEASPEEILTQVRLVEPAYSLRSGFIYQNIMYAAAGAVIEAVSGIEWDEFIRTRFFRPIGMTDSIPLIVELPGQPNQASPHYEIDGQVEVIENADVDPVAAAGSIWSSVTDMARWLNVMLEGGVADDEGSRLFSAEVYGELLRPQTMVPSSQFYPTARLTQPHWTTYALGWFQHDYNGRAVSFHTGSIDGMVAIAGMIPDERLGVYVLANLDHAELRHALMYTIFDLFSPTPEGRSGRDWSADLLQMYGEFGVATEQQRAEAESQRVEGTSPTLPLERYAGTYTHPLRGTVEVTLDDGVLRLKAGTRFDGVLGHWNFDTFIAHWSRRWYGTGPATFLLDARGEPTRIEVNGGVYVRDEEDGD